MGFRLHGAFKFQQSRIYVFPQVSAGGICTVRLTHYFEQVINVDASECFEDFQSLPSLARIGTKPTKPPWDPCQSYAMLSLMVLAAGSTLPGCVLWMCMWESAGPLCC